MGRNRNKGKRVGNIYTDASYDGEVVGIATYFEDDCGLSDYNSFTTRSYTSLKAEIAAVKMALKILVENPDFYDIVYIWIDCIPAIHTINDTRLYTYGRKHFLYNLKQRIQTLEHQGIQLSFHWVKGHSGNRGNIIADAMANYARIYFFSSLDLNETLTEYLAACGIFTDITEEKRKM